MENLLKIPKKTLNLSLLLFFIVAVCLVGRLSFSSKNPYLFGHAAFRISSGSMEPKYPINTFIVVKKADISSIEVGDVIAFRSKALGGGLAFHRVVRKNESGVYTKGDNVKLEDNQLITSETLVGKEVIKITLFAKYLTLIRDIRGILLFLVMPLLSIICVYYSFSIFRRNKNLQ